MSHSVRKMIRTVQSRGQWIKTGKERVYSFARRVLKMPHERDFRLLEQLSHGVAGCYVDVGANKGQSIESILLCRPDAQIVSFEPNSHLARELCARYTLRQSVTVYPVGLADYNGVVTLFIPVYRGVFYDELASLERSAAEGWLNGHTMYGFRPEHLEISECLCEVRTLDSFSLNPGFIKIDAQGLEYRVLRGSLETLKRCRPLLLVEGVRADYRITAMTGDLGYEECFFDGRTLQRGAGVGDNTYLITRERLREIRV